MISQKSGIHIDIEPELVADGSFSEQKVNFVSHAHSDHAVKSGSGEIVCSEATEELLNSRYNTQIRAKDHQNIRLIPSGHIVGSSAALINDDVLYTGDVSLQNRLYMDGFEPVNSEKLILETTYGVPSYRLPDQNEVVNEIRDWIMDNDRTLLLFGYSLGKAQKIQYIAQEATDRPIVGHKSVLKMNEAVEKVSDLEFRAKSYKENKKLLEQNGILIAPSRSSQADWIEKLVDRHDAIKAGFSGWAVNDSFKFRGGFDKTFPLSDHCGFRDLVKLVEEVDPERVYTHHGFDEAFASYLKNELGYDARALKNNQSSLRDF